MQLELDVSHNKIIPEYSTRTPQRWGFVCERCFRLLQTRTSFAFAKTQLAGNVAAAEFLLARWLDHPGHDYDCRILWDLALIEIKADSTLATEVHVWSLQYPNVRCYRSVQSERLVQQSIERIASYLATAGK